MITPSDIRDKSFSTTRDGGYDVKEVNAFLDSVTDSYSAVVSENKELFRKMEILANKIEEYREEEDSIKSALITAQKTADSITKQAKDGAESLIAEATEKAQKIVDDANEKAKQVTGEADQYAHGVRDENFHEAQKMIDEAETKANEAINAAKVVAGSIVQEAKELAGELMTQAKSRKAEYETLLSGVQSQTLQLKADLLALYQNQIDSLNASVTFDVHQAAEEADTAYNEILARIDSFVHTELDGEAEGEPAEAPAEETAEDQEEPVQETIEPAAEEPAAQPEEAQDAPQETAPAETADAPSPAAAEPAEEAGSKKHGSDAELFSFSMDGKDGDAADDQTLLTDQSDDAPAAKVSPDVKNAIDAFSGNDLTPIENQKSAIGILDDDDDDMLGTDDFGSLFAADNEIPARPTEKLSLIPPDDEDEEDDEPKFKGFFRKKK